MASSMLVLSTRQKGGKIGISRHALIQIVLSQIESFPGITLVGEAEKKMIKTTKLKSVEAVFTVHSGVNVVLTRNNILRVTAKIAVDESLNPGKACLELQERISSALCLATEGVKIEVLLELKGIGDGKPKPKPRKKARR